MTNDQFILTYRRVLFFFTTAVLSFVDTHMLLSDSLEREARLGVRIDRMEIGTKHTCGVRCSCVGLLLSY